MERTKLEDITYTMPDNSDPKFYRDILIGLFAPSEYDNPQGREILGEEFDKAFEELKKRVENGKGNEASPKSGDKAHDA